MRTAQAQIELEPVPDYVFATPSGPAALSSLFGEKQDLAIHQDRPGKARQLINGRNGG